ncbi:hypothetical protein DXX93_11110 [Thalassotalea euphylliae]|uniref:Uncharacterized protein n=2 Tax=Thalassotalea euphylliae TaxID=1655234 RepID=A0A3E0TRU7_9GAMM|nr:hypothetical protein DXX93_11110 [Thalassotalea euphylliae]
MDESEMILLQLVGKLTKQDPKTILKNIGIIGAENLLTQYVNEASQKGQLVHIRNCIADTCKEYGELKYSYQLTELSELKVKLANMESLATPTKDEKSYKALTHGLTLVAGLFLGLVLALGLKY